MSEIEDIRQLMEDLVTPDLKAVRAEVQASGQGEEQRDEMLSAKIDAQFERLSKISAEHPGTISIGRSEEPREIGSTAAFFASESSYLMGQSILFTQW